MNDLGIEFVGEDLAKNQYTNIKGNDCIGRVDVYGRQIIWGQKIPNFQCPIYVVVNKWGTLSLYSTVTLVHIKQYGKIKLMLTGHPWLKSFSLKGGGKMYRSNPSVRVNYDGYGNMTYKEVPYADTFKIQPGATTKYESKVLFDKIICALIRRKQKSIIKEFKKTLPKPKKKGEHNGVFI